MKTPSNAHESGSLSALAWACRRDLKLALRARADLAVILIFFILVASLFPLALDPDPVLLRRIGPGVAWVSALLATLLGLGRLFALDHADGTLEQLLLAPAPLAALVSGKVLAHWLTSCAPLVVLSPLSGVQFGLDGESILILAASLALLVFGAGAVESAAAGLGAEAHLSLLGAAAILACVAGPLATALAVKIAYE
jgi:heme exporter protein B